MKIAKTFIRNFQFDFVLNNITNISKMKKIRILISNGTVSKSYTQFKLKTYTVRRTELTFCCSSADRRCDKRTDRQTDIIKGLWALGLVVLNTSTLSSGLTFETIPRFPEISSICKPYNKINRIFVTDFTVATFYFNKFLVLGCHT